MLCFSYFLFLLRRHFKYLNKKRISSFLNSVIISNLGSLPVEPSHFNHIDLPCPVSSKVKIYFLIFIYNLLKSCRAIFWKSLVFSFYLLKLNPFEWRIFLTFFLCLSPHNFYVKFSNVDFWFFCILPRLLIQCYPIFVFFW